MSKKNSGLRNYIFDSIKEYVYGDILEVGSGLGSYTKLLQRLGKVTAIDNNNEYVSSVPGTEFFDISWFVWPRRMQNHFDTIVAINVLEHVENETSAMINMADSLKPDGTIVLILPAYRWLYGHVDEMIGHKRRYVPKMIKYPSLEVEKIFYINSLGIFGWWLTKLLKTNTVNSKFLNIYDRFIPIVRFVDWAFDYSWGLSMVVVLRRAES